MSSLSLFRSVFQGVSSGEVLNLKGDELPRVDGMNRPHCSGLNPHLGVEPPSRSLWRTEWEAIASPGSETFGSGQSDGDRPLGTDVFPTGGFRVEKLKDVLHPTAQFFGFRTREYKVASHREGN